MEFAPPLNNLRTQLCIIVSGFSSDMNRSDVWPEAAVEFLRRMHKLGLQITIIGPRPPQKFGSKRTIRFMDRHEVVGMKLLTASKAYRLELRVLNSRNKSWTRLRAEACVTMGQHGIWPTHYEGWTVPGTLSIYALARWVTEQKLLPGQEFAFVGSSNMVFRWAIHLLDRGARSCYIIEDGSELHCWRSYRDRFIAKGGRIFLRHKILRVEQDTNKLCQLYLANDQGTMILTTDTLVLAPVNENTLNAPEQWKGGLFYIQRRTIPGEPFSDEDGWFERVDWRELYWRVARLFGVVDHPEAEGALKSLRVERRKLLEYRRAGQRRDLKYSGKILERETLAEVQSSTSVPRSFDRAKPVASLECFENVPCRACADSCPEAAIEIRALMDQPILAEDKCTGCGACVAVCPSGAAVMVRESSVEQRGHYYFPDDTKELWKPGRQLQLLNRRGEVLGMGRVAASQAYEGGAHRVLEVTATNVHLWEARGFRIPKSEFALDPLLTDVSASNQPKRGWVTINGVRRLSIMDVPITVALWKLGQKRFADALFCRDGGCRLCEVKVDGKLELACRTNMREGCSVEFKPSVSQGRGKPLCPCKNVQEEEYKGLLEEGVSEGIARELTGMGGGQCHGRWCLASSEMCEDKTQRPIFHGYEASPWREIWAEDVIETDLDDDSF